MAVHDAHELAASESSSPDDDVPVTPREFKRLRKDISELLSLMKKKD